MKIFNNKIINTIILLIFVFIAPACIKKKANNLNIKPNNIWYYNIGIEGVECKLCAYKVVKRLEKIENFSDVKMVCTPNFRECYAQVARSDIKNNFSVAKVKDVIENEGFELNYISGNFIGTFDDKLDKFSLIDQDLEIKFKNSNHINYMLPINQKTTVNSKLMFQKRLNQYWLQIN